ncbi:hypothetical protein CJ030_MR8G018163 [Morella rubra]|uniref:Myb/SANT-like domain-containing protein n=1 Tax=Morella rubra TaxID=262757 RepID=A0A6A1USM0_9ROSI|nr:hypothetical protein CJ030_MR8G018163 [Morella rubra]
MKDCQNISDTIFVKDCQSFVEDYWNSKTIIDFFCLIYGRRKWIKKNICGQQQVGLLLNILQDCIGNGTIVSGRFDSKAQITVMELINRCVERLFTAKQVKGKWDRLKRAYIDFAFILKQTGFSWDDDRHTVVASEEAWRNPKLVRYKRQGCPNFELMKAVFSRSTATGSGRHASTHAPVSPVNEPLSEDVQYNMGPVHVDLEQDPPVITQMGSPPTQATLSPRKCSWEACS